MKECKDCGTEFKPFVHNATRCRDCVTKNNTALGQHGKNKRRVFNKNCEWCGEEYELTGPASRYCSGDCREHSQRLNRLKRNMTISKEQYLKDIGIKNCQACGDESFVLCGVSDKAEKLPFDHCHITGVYRGRLCHNCNRALGLLGDNIAVVEGLLKYMEGAETIPKGSRTKRSEAHNTEE